MDPGKKSRWRRSVAPELEAKDASKAGRWNRLSTLHPVKSIGNEAAAHAFRGLHGKKSNFSLVESAADRALSAVLDGNAHYYKALASEVEDFSTYEALVAELEYKPIWMTGGLTLHRPAAVGSESQLKKSPTYERIVRFLAGFFGVEPIRSLVNHYRSAEDFTAFHADQYYGGVNMTIGASFGEVPFSTAKRRRFCVHRRRESTVRPWSSTGEPCKVCWRMPPHSWAYFCDSLGSARSGDMEGKTARPANQPPSLECFGVRSWPR